MVYSLMNSFGLDGMASCSPHQRPSTDGTAQVFAVAHWLGVGCLVLCRTLVSIYIYIYIYIQMYISVSPMYQPYIPYICPYWGLAQFVATGTDFLSAHEIKPCTLISSKPRILKPEPKTHCLNLRPES